MPYCTGAVTPAGKAARVCLPQAAQRQACARCSVTVSGRGSGKSNTCRATWSVAIAAVNAVPHVAQAGGEWSTVVSGVSVRRRVSPGWPGCPPVCLPDGCRRLPIRGGFVSPSLDGGLPLLPLFSPRRRSNSAIRSRNPAISAAWRVSCASTSSISSPFVSSLRAARSIEALNRQPGAASNKIYVDIIATRSPIVPRPVLTETPLVVILLGSNDLFGGEGQGPRDAAEVGAAAEHVQPS